MGVDFGGQPGGDDDGWFFHLFMLNVYIAPLQVPYTRRRAQSKHGDKGQIWAAKKIDSLCMAWDQEADCRPFSNINFD